MYLDYTQRLSLLCKIFAYAEQRDIFYSDIEQKIKVLFW